jgi:DNA-binding LacI/PurR family transcriptional regulator
MVPAATAGGPDPRVVLRAAVDGFVAYSMPDDDPHVAAVLQRPVPTVVVDQPVDVSGVDWVGIDDHAGAAEIGSHLAGRGHRQVRVITWRLGPGRNDGPPGPARLNRVRVITWRLGPGLDDGPAGRPVEKGSPHAVQRARLDGFAAGLGDGGVEWADVPVEERFENSPAAGASAAAALLASDPGLTAIGCTSDVLALGVLGPARDRGLSVPDDLSVTGFDDVPDAVRAGLTTVHQPLLEKGRVAGRLLLDEGDRPSARRVLLPAQLIVRSTTGLAPR